MINRPRITNIPGILGLSMLLMALLATLSMAAEFKQSFTYASENLELTNLIGEVTVLPADGSKILVEISVRGDDADTDLIEFSSHEGRTSELAVIFPMDEYKKYVYPAMGKGSSTSIHFNDDEGHDDSWLRSLFSFGSGKKIKVEGKGRGLEMWADITVRLPEGSSLVLVNGVGTIIAENCQADLDLDISSGSITAENIVGTFKADTGSGRVVAQNITGNTNIDTGSGSVKVIGFKGGTLLVDTGSGRVTVAQAICKELNIDTGSGGVDARGIEANTARIDTGSGSVVFQLDRMGTGKFDVDTGSGSVQFFLPENASASIIADTGSGGVDVNLAGAIVKRKDRDRVELTVGDGQAKVRLDTGSGSVNISY